MGLRGGKSARGWPQLVALEVWNAARECADVFGEIDRPMPEYVKETEAKQQQLDELFAEIGQRWSMETVEFQLLDERSRVQIKPR